MICAGDEGIDVPYWETPDLYIESKYDDPYHTYQLENMVITELKSYTQRKE